MQVEPDLNTLDGIVFTTDRAAIIQDIGENNWNAFAVQNGAPELQASAVIHRNLFDFISGRQVRDQFQQVLDKISTHPSWCWVLPYRCDAPDRERGCAQSLRPIFDGDVCTGFMFQSIEHHSRQRPPIPLFDFKMLQQRAAEDHTLPVVQMCSWCQRVKYPPISHVHWIEAADYYAKGGRTNVRLSHAICNDCLDATADPVRIDSTLQGHPAS